MKNITRTIEKITLYGMAYDRTNKTVEGFAWIGYECTDDEIIKEYERLNPDRKVVDINDRDIHKIKLSMPIERFVEIANEVKEV